METGFCHVNNLLRKTGQILIIIARDDLEIKLSKYIEDISTKHQMQASH